MDNKLFIKFDTKRKQVYSISFTQFDEIVFDCFNLNGITVFVAVIVDCVFHEFIHFAVDVHFRDRRHGIRAGSRSSKKFTSFCVTSSGCKMLRFGRGLPPLRKNYRSASEMKVARTEPTKIFTQTAISEKNCDIFPYTYGHVNSWR